ncbi:uncharacterized protein LOC121393785 isoform X3 [Xenopus laevis]|uniref:Uncharacterized protein LOC121393785 isoform X3 n=1 Tax=Xenopus laevis TaxID=8355 RepID=A0A8J1KR07_XENLA|nr:uncharacterized protein LOC121393785 isoform X3 [Xenopus laevis]
MSNSTPKTAVNQEHISGFRLTYCLFANETWGLPLLAGSRMQSMDLCDYRSGETLKEMKWFRRGLTPDIHLIVFILYRKKNKLSCAI